MSAAWVLVGAAWLGWGWRTLGHMQELEVRRHWYCAALYCTILHCTVLYCTVLYCTVLYYTVLTWAHLVAARCQGWQRSWLHIS